MFNFAYSEQIKKKKNRNKMLKLDHDFVLTDFQIQRL